MSRRKRFILRAALVLASTLFALLLVEAALRCLRPSYSVYIPASHEYDAELGFRLRPDAHLLRTTDFQQESLANRLGTANFQESFEGYEKLVFAVGDSYTQGLGVPADMSYPFQLDLTLNRDEGGFYVRKYGVVNLGVSGYGGEQSLLSLRRRAEQLGPPSVILYLGCQNDFEDDLIFLHGHRHSQLLRGSPRWGPLSPPLAWLVDETQLGLKWKRFAVSRRRARLYEDALGQMQLGGGAPPAAELEAPVLERLAAYARERGALLVVGWSDEGASYGWLRSWASERGIAFADWAARAGSVRAALPALPMENQHSGGHHRGWANRLIAEEFARQIRARGE